MNMKQTRKNSLLVALLAALATSGSAQVLGGAANAAGNAAGAAHLTPPPVPSARPTPITPAPVSANTGIASRASGAANVGNNAGVRAGQSAAGSVNGASRAAEVRGNVGVGGKAGVDAARASGTVKLNSKADTQASARGRERGLTVATAATAGVVSEAEAQTTVQQIEATAHGARGTLSAELEAKIDATAKAMADLRAEARQLKGEARTRFDNAYAELRAQERALRSELKASVRESKEAAWGEVQSRLAQEYRAYVKAAAEASAAADAGTTTEAPKS